METSTAQKPLKATKKSNSSAIRVSNETRKRLASELAKINRKSLGKRVKFDALILCLISKLSADDVKRLQDASLTGRDRLEQNYRAYCAKFGSVTRDEFLALISDKAASQMLEKDAAKIQSKNAAVSEGKIEA